MEASLRKLSEWRLCGESRAAEGEPHWPPHSAGLLGWALLSLGTAVTGVASSSPEDRRC